ncbi:iron chelate uptake ABC transporter family permease subunit [Vibrio astriarenae]|uniref:Iron chelate uptake ABC transporter family permease subunit n=1 Tax=Vibrio astriarenae TaxID=1481923 RepID=A0A7Z2T758_9VIBR|nr:iron chelate uptake ABC transporter family permease subunit [Vibrio astriarenae]QIA65616.1 iron chelate uptake ABC transporter family permease subunit [Vibrio astriarenae]
MRNSVKVLILAILSVVFVAFFLGKGLTIDNYQFFLSRRIPKVLAIVIAAIAIAASSLVFQTITNNRILTPSILGFDSLYVMLQVLMVVLFGSMSPLVINAGLNYVVTTSIMLVLAMTLFGFYFRRGNRNIFTLLLIGIVLSSLFSSVTGFFTMLVDPNEFTMIQGAMFASFNNVNGDLVYWSLIPLAVSTAYLLYLAPKLDVFWLGIDNAKSLGVDTQKVTMQVMFVITILVSISTVLVGPVLFFGLIVVALTRQIFSGYQHRFLLLASSLLSMAMLISGQWIVENLLDFETTISVIINFVGGIYFLVLLSKQKSLIRI